ncbi:MAG: M3 family oligoendopeptidase [Candidatus Lokiarchaeota archaeon]|nr:M3 family oligoendopeptidase [Candidatus Lokiarchaeota archaeon]
MTREKAIVPVKPRKHIDQAIRGNSWGPVKKAIRHYEKEAGTSANDLLTFIERYTELYDAVETSTMIKAAAFLNDQSVGNILKVAGRAIKVTLPAYFERKKVYKFIANHPGFKELPAEHEHLQRLVKKEVEEKSDHLHAAAEYLRVLTYTMKSGKIRVNFEGKKVSLPRLRGNLWEPDRGLRERSWRLIFDTIAEKEAWFTKTFDKLRSNREKQARKAGFENCRDYFHHKRGRFDYTPQDCFKFHDAVEASVLPFIKELNKARCDELGIDVLRPWDRYVNLGGHPLKPYQAPGELVEKMIRVFGKVRPEYGATLQFMHDHGFIDHENRRGKVPGAMCTPLIDYQCGFITANTVGTHDDVCTLAHEGGHAMHDAAISSIPIGMYHELMPFPMEAAEVASMAMEFLVLDELGEFYKDPGDIALARAYLIEDAVRLLPWVSTVDAFQQWIYTMPEHTAPERDAFFGSLVDRFEGAAGIDYSGLEKQKRVMWIRQPHVYQSPFYYIEYGIAQLAAFGIYKNLRSKGRTAIDMYDAFLHAGNSKPLPELYRIAGVNFDFSREYMAEIMAFLRADLATTRP